MPDVVRFVHCADLHIGAGCHFFGSKQRSRRAEVRQTLQRIVSFCQKEKVSLLLIAGDLFDDLFVSNDIVSQVRDAFLSIPDIIVAIAAGNHDPATPDSPYLRSDFWPKNVKLFTGKCEVFEFPSLGIRLMGAGFSGAYCYQSLLRHHPVLDDQYKNFGIFHGDLVSENARSDYNAITKRQIEESGLDYLALGHIHKRTEPEKIGKTTYAYSGCPEGQGFDETGIKGIYFGELSNDRCQVRFIPFCQRIVTQLSVDVSDLMTKNAIVERIRQSMQEKIDAGYPYEEQIYGITLVGEPSEEAFHDMESIQAELSEVWYLKIKNKTRPKIDLEALVKENSLRGIFVKRMLAMPDHIPTEQKELALRLGLRSFFESIPME